MSGHRPVWSEVDLDAIRANVSTVRTTAAPAAVLAVVKADGYGHGAVPAAGAALDAGAQWLGVALVEEGLELRDAGIDAPILVLAEPPPGAGDAVVEFRLTPVVYTSEGVETLAKAVATAAAPPLGVHLKIDTGMNRVGCSPEAAATLALTIRARDELELDGLLTHLAVADEPDDHGYTAEQLARFESALVAIGEPRPRVVHAANSAAAIRVPQARYDLVRAGIACYGIDPAPTLAGAIPLRPALALKAAVSHVHDVPSGTGVSYGLHYTTDRATRLATVPIGYADGVPRNLGLRGGEVLVRDARRPVAGAVTMDQLVVDCADDPVEVGDEVVLIGRQGAHEITATEWAQHMGTIGYEIVCGIGPRVPRRYLG